MKRRLPKGSVALETAVVLLTVTALLIAVHNFGHAWRVKQVLRCAVREGCRAAVSQPALIPNDPKVIAIIDDILQKGGLDSDEYDRSVTYDGRLNTGIAVTVTASTPYTFVSGKVIGMNTPINLSATSVMRYEQVVSRDFLPEVAQGAP